MIRASGPSCGGGSGTGPGLLLDFPGYRGTAQEVESMEQLMRSLVPFERLADVRYRVCRDQKKPMHLLGGGGRLLALETFCLVDATSTSPGASLRTQAQAQASAPRGKTAIAPVRARIRALSAARSVARLALLLLLLRNGMLHKTPAAMIVTVFLWSPPPQNCA